MISGSLAKNDLQLKASYGSSPPCTHDNIIYKCIWCAWHICYVLHEFYLYDIRVIHVYVYIYILYIYETLHMTHTHTHIHIMFRVAKTHRTSYSYIYIYYIYETQNILMLCTWYCAATCMTRRTSDHTHFSDSDCIIQYIYYTFWIWIAEYNIYIIRIPCILCIWYCIYVYTYIYIYYIYIYIYIYNYIYIYTYVSNVLPGFYVYDIGVVYEFDTLIYT